MSLTHGQYNLIAKFVEADLASFEEAEAAFARNDTGQIAAWNRRLTRLGIRPKRGGWVGSESEATSFYDRQNIARRK